MKILWVGAGLGEIPKRSPLTFTIWDEYIAGNLPISVLKLIDKSGIPKLPFGKDVPFKQVAKKENFFNVNKDDLDIIIIDRIEAWLLGDLYWPSLGETPFNYILNQWELKILQLRPHEVWVRHDGVKTSTIQPQLRPVYKVVSFAPDFPTFNYYKSTLYLQRLDRWVLQS